MKLLELRRCKACGQEKPRSDFYFQKSNGQTSTKCKPCKSQESVRYASTLAERNPAAAERRRAYHADYRAKNAERMRQYWANYYASNRETILPRVKEWQRSNKEYAAARAARRRAMTSGPDSYTGDDVKRLFSAQKGKCACCRTSLARGYDVDHVVPLSKGGGNGKDNIQLLCPTCNASKGAKDPVIFMQQRGYLL